MLHPETMRGIVAIVLFLAAVVLMLAFTGLGGKGGGLVFGGVSLMEKVLLSTDTNKIMVFLKII